MMPKKMSNAGTPSPIMELLEGRQLLSHTVSATKMTFSTTAASGLISSPIDISVTAKLTANGLPLRSADVFFVVDNLNVIGQGQTGRSGYAVLNIPNIYAGNHSIAAYFTGATRYAASQSKAVAVSITTPRYTTTADGLKYATITAGSGAAATAGETATADYAGYLTTGSLFDTSIKANPDTSTYDTPLGEPVAFNLYSGTVTPDGDPVLGFNEGLIGMKVGETRVLIIPPDLGYGSAGQGPVPGNATIVFFVKLEAISA